MTPLLTVWITTYNHENFIAEALESVLNQQTSFAFDIVLGEDCSTDRTRQIVIAYANKYPEKIRLYLPEKNLGMIEMFRRTYEMCTARYIALLDGDDYWIDPLKLQKQVDLLETDPNISFCFHKVKYYNEKSKRLYERKEPDKYSAGSVLSHEDLTTIHNPISAPSVVMRNVLGRKLPEWFYFLPYPDLGMYLLLLQHGKAKYLNEMMGVYRFHPGGAWSGEKKYVNDRKHIALFESVERHLPLIDKVLSAKVIYHYAKQCLKKDLSTRNVKGALRHGGKLLYYSVRLFWHRKRP